MMANLAKRGADIAIAARQRRVRAVADRLRNILGSSAVEVDEARVLVSGRGMVKRWLTDPSLRFLRGGSQ